MKRFVEVCRGIVFVALAGAVVLGVGTLAVYAWAAYSAIQMIPASNP